MHAEYDGESSELSDVEGEACLFRVWDIPPLPITFILGFQVRLRAQAPLPPVQLEHLYILRTACWRIARFRFFTVNSRPARPPATSLRRHPVDLMRSCPTTRSRQCW